MYNIKHIRFLKTIAKFINLQLETMVSAPVTLGLAQSTP